MPNLTKLERVSLIVSLIIGVVALGLSGLTPYFQFFHQVEALQAIYSSASIGEEMSSIKYAIANSGDTTIMLCSAVAYVYTPPPKNLSPFGNAAYEPRKGEEEKQFPIILKPGDMREIELGFQCKKKQSSPASEVHVEFSSIDSNGRNHSVIDKLMWLNSFVPTQTNVPGEITFGVYRAGSKKREHLNKPINLIE